MTAFTLGEATLAALSRAAVSRAAPPALRASHRTPHRTPHRTGAPVRRDSVEAGTFEHLFFAPPARGEADRLVRMARAALDAGRRVKSAARAERRELSAAERALAGVTAGAVRVYEELCMLARVNAGRVYPSYDHLARATALGRATIARAIAALEDAGFLVRQRRFRRVEGEGPGPRWEQTSNAYRPVVPQRLLALLPRWLRPAPVPVDALQHAADEADEQARLRGQLTCRELAQASVGGALGRALARLGAAIDGKLLRSESHEDPEPRPESFVRTPDGVGLTGRHANDLSPMDR